VAGGARPRGEGTRFRLRRATVLTVLFVVLGGIATGVVVAVSYHYLATPTTTDCPHPLADTATPQIASLVGDPVATATDFVAEDCGLLSDTWAPSHWPFGRVLGLVGDAPHWTHYPRFTADVVVSAGPLKTDRAVLPLANGPPVSTECGAGLSVTAQGAASPLTCGGDHVNVGAWDYYARAVPQPVVFTLTRGASRSIVLDAFCANADDQNVAEYELARAYYGWSYPISSLTCQGP
jgi:hypothetical protein